MAQTSQAMVRESFMNETVLGKLKMSLGEEDRAALERMLGELREFKTTAEAASQISPMETLLLLAVMRQSRKMECLEVLLQRMAERMLT